MSGGVGGVGVGWGRDGYLFQGHVADLAGVGQRGEALHGHGGQTSWVSVVGVCPFVWDSIDSSKVR